MISLSPVYLSNWKASSAAFEAHNTISLGKSSVNSVAKQGVENSQFCMEVGPPILRDSVLVSINWLEGHIESRG